MCLNPFDQKTVSFSFDHIKIFGDSKERTGIDIMKEDIELKVKRICFELSKKN